MKSFISWSGGKDAALAFFTCQQQGLRPDLLLTTVSAATNRVAMHGVRRVMVEAQAAAVGLPLRVVTLPESPSMEAYEQTMRAAHRELAEEGYEEAVFGDLFLQDLKRYREALLAKDGLRCRFPLWGERSEDLLHRFWAEGFEALVVCTADAALPSSFCGRRLDEAFVADLPTGVDPCGENGEFHSFVYAGPLFRGPVSFEKGEVVQKMYPAHKAAEGSAPLPPASFHFQDLLPRP